MRTFRYLVLVAVLSVCSIATPALAAASALKPFFGTYEGVSLYQRTEARARELRITIEPDGDAGFFIEWQATLYKREGEESTRFQALRFQPIAPGGALYAAVPSGESGPSAPTRDPLSGGRLAWARVGDRVLSINILAIDDRGDWTMQIYERALTAEGLGLAYMRLDNGQIAHRVWGSLKRIAE